MLRPGGSKAEEKCEGEEEEEAEETTPGGGVPLDPILDRLCSHGDESVRVVVVVRDSSGPSCP